MTAKQLPIKFPLLSPYEKAASHCGMRLYYYHKPSVLRRIHEQIDEALVVFRHHRRGFGSGMFAFL